MRNNEILAQGANHDKKPETTSASAIVKMQAGEHVWVNLNKGTVMGHPMYFTTFSGYRIGIEAARVSNPIDQYSMKN